LDLVEFPAHEALDGENGVLGFVTASAFRHLADETPPAFANATTDGVSRPPSGLVMTTGFRLP
jgi:hypothetical protein